MTWLRMAPTILGLAWLGCAASPTSAATCAGVMSNMDFGAVSVRSGVANATSGTLQLVCNASLTPTVGVCVRFGPGSGGAGPSNSPRYMRRAGSAQLAYELRAAGSGPAFATWNEVFVVVPTPTGSGNLSVPVYADITSASVSVGTGDYSSTFSGAIDAQIEYETSACDQPGTAATLPPFAVTATVTSSCEVDTGSLNFGNMGGTILSPVDATGSVVVRCTSATDFALRLGNGSGAGASGPEDRRMTNGTSLLRYGLYQNTGRSLPWGDLPGNDLAATGTGLDQSFPIYGRIHAGQTVTAGVYTDTVLVTVEY